MMIATHRSRSALAVGFLFAAAFAVGCDSSSTGSGPSDAPVTLSVVASDESAPTGPGGISVELSGTLTLIGLDLELWDGEMWQLVVEDETSAEIVLADASASIVLVSATELPGGDYTKARLTADQATIDVSATFDGKTYSREFRTRSGRQVVIEKDVTVTENPDGSRTLTIDLRSIRSVRLNGNDLGIEGDFGDDFSG